MHTKENFNLIFCEEIKSDILKRENISITFYFQSTSLCSSS